MPGFCVADDAVCALPVSEPSDHSHLRAFSFPPSPLPRLLLAFLLPFPSPSPAPHLPWVPCPMHSAVFSSSSRAFTATHRQGTANSHVQNKPRLHSSLAALRPSPLLPPSLLRPSYSSRALATLRGAAPASAMSSSRPRLSRALMTAPARPRSACLPPFTLPSPTPVRPLACSHSLTLARARLLVLGGVACLLPVVKATILTAACVPLLSAIRRHSHVHALPGVGLGGYGACSAR